MPAGGSCLLGSINLSEFVTNEFTEKASFNFEDFDDTLRIAIRGLNVVLDEGMPFLPLEEQQYSVKNWRQIGLGILGLADMLVKMGIKYGSEESLELCEKISKFMIDKSIYYSALLAKEMGAYPKYDKDSTFKNPFFLAHASNETKLAVEEWGMCNSQLLTCAPTGSISNLFGVSGGIEPYFAFSYRRKTESLHNDDVYYDIPTTNVLRYMEAFNIKEEKDLPDFFVTSKDIHYKDRINMQSVWQDAIDASISSTVNLPNNTTKEQVFDLYMYAIEKNVKGLTVYRAGCAREGILQTDSEVVETKEKEVLQLDSIVPISRGELGKTIGTTSKLKTACGNLYITINRDEHGNIIETFVADSKSGGCKSNINGLSRMASLALRSGTMVEEIIDQLKGISCAACTRAFSKGEKLDGLSCPDILAKVIQSEYDSDEIYIKKTKRGKGKKKQPVKEKAVVEPKSDLVKCPDCGEQLIFDGGCNTCMSCGYSKCS